MITRDYLLAARASIDAALASLDAAPVTGTPPDPLPPGDGAPPAGPGQPDPPRMTMLWKPGPEPKKTNDGNAAVLFSPAKQRMSGVVLADASGTVLGHFKEAGFTNGDRHTWRYSMPGPTIRPGVAVEGVHAASGAKFRFPVDDPSKRYERIAGARVGGNSTPQPDPHAPNPPSDNVTRDKRACLWFSGGAGMETYGFRNAIAINRSGFTRGVENWLQINPVDGDRPNPAADAKRAKAGGYSAVCLDIEAGPGGNGFDLALHRAYYAECRKAGVKFVGAPKSGWEHFLRTGANYASVVDHMQRNTDGQCWWNYGINRTRWAAQLTEARRAGYTKPIYCLAADGNGRPPPYTQFDENVEIMRMCGAGGEGWGIFFPHKQPDLSRRYAAAAKGIYA